MGKSRKIQDLSKVNDDFNSFMQDLEKDMGEYANQYEAEFISQVESFYADDKDIIQIEGKVHRDYQIETEFSLDNIKNIIEKTTKEVFEISNAEEQQKEQDEKKKVMTALGNYEQMALKIAVNFLSNVLSSLTFDQSADYKYDIQQISIGPGLTLHLLIVEKYYDGKGFFEKKRVIQNFIEYRLIFSKKIAAAEMDIEYINTQMNEYRENSQTLSEIQKDYRNLVLSKEFVQENREGELHELAQNYKIIIEDLTQARKEAYQAVKEVCGYQQPVNGLKRAAIGKNKNLLEADGNSTNSTAMVKSDILREKALKKVNAPLMAYIKGE